MDDRNYIEQYLREHDIPNKDLFVGQLRPGPYEGLDGLVDTPVQEVLRIHKIRHSLSRTVTVGRLELIDTLEQMHPETLVVARAFLTDQGGLGLYTDKNNKFVGMVVLSPMSWTPLVT